MKLKRVFVRYEKWEDYQNGLFNMETKNSELLLIEQCKKLLSDPYLFGLYARLVCREWKIAAAVNLTNTSRNRQAWIGQASCLKYCMANEDITKTAWRELTEEQQTKANNTADAVIAEYEMRVSLGDSNAQKTLRD